jgi:hypothetical protein
LSNVPVKVQQISPDEKTEVSNELSGSLISGIPLLCIHNYLLKSVSWVWWLHPCNPSAQRLR